MTGGLKFIRGCLALSLALAAGCDDGGGSGSEDLRVSFVTPAESEPLGCEKDRDKTTTAVVEFNVEVLVTLDGASTEGLTARLLADGAEIGQSDEVLDTGRIIFANAALPLGDLSLTVEVLRDGSVVGSAARAVATSFDTSDPVCSPDTAPTLTFDTPSAGMTFTGEGVADLSADFLFNAELSLEGDYEGDVRITVGGVDGGSASPDDNGKVVFTDLRLPTGDGSETVPVIATVTGRDGADYTAQVDLVVAIDGCTLTLTPAPSGEACDIDVSDDIDPDTEGFQVRAEAQSNCSEVVFTVNGETTTAAVADGRAEATLTLVEGDNTFSATATTPGGIAGSAAEQTLVASSAASAVSLELEDNTVFAAGAARTVSGSAEGLSSNSVDLVYAPELAGAPASADVADGSFSFELPEVPYYCGTVTAQGEPVCGGAVASSAQSFCIDTVVPVLTLNAPAVVSPADDVDDAAEGVQLDWEVEVADARGVDYPITVECGPAAGPFAERSDAPIQRADVDGTGTIRVTLTGADAGGLVCRAVMDATPNTPDLVTSEVRFVFDAPTFAVSEPRMGEAPHCYTDEVTVGGQGAELDENGAAISVLISDGDGAEVATVPLAALGQNAYATVFGAEGGPDALADGPYTATVTGEVVGGLVVAVNPAEPVPFVVDTVAPEFALEAPAQDAPIGIAEDANNDLSDCVQAPIRARLTDATTQEICYSVNGSAERCGMVEDGIWTSEAITFLDGDNSVVLSGTDCAGNSNSAEFTVQTVGCPERIQILAPNDGAQLPVAGDLDEAAGYQTDVQLHTALAEGTDIQVVVDGGTAFDGVIDANGDATIRVTIEHAPDQAENLDFTLQGRTTDGSNIGPISNGTIRFEQPAIVLAPFDDCLNSQVLDAVAGNGFDILVTATTTGVEAGQTATVTATCGDEAVETQATGTVQADGSIEFEALAVAEDASCDLSATVNDAAGQAAVGQTDVLIDRVAPTVRFLLPAPGATITSLNDEDRRNVAEANGIQLTPRLEVCGAAGQTLTATASMGLFGDAPMEVVVGEGDCANPTLDTHTLPSGELEFGAMVADACGNQTTINNTFTVDSGASLAITSPADGASVRAIDDLDAEAAGCQFEVRGVALGMADEAIIEICTDFDQGGASDLCQTARAGECVREGAEGNDISCPVSLSEGTHTLTVVGRFGEDVVSEPAVLRLDCTAPTVSQIEVLEIGDDACVNRMERINRGAPDNAAQVTVRISTEGIEDDRSIALRIQPSNVNLTNVLVQDNQVEARVFLPAGEHQIYAVGSDAVGNPLAPFGEGVSFPIRVDTVVPTPNVLNLVEAGCLNSEVDDADGAEGLQYVVQAQSGAQEGETVSMALAIDGGAAMSVDTDEPVIDFAAVALAEGQRTATITAMDACGNVGSVGGFAQLDGRDDWANPLALSFSVDTVAPQMSLAGIAEGTTLDGDDDADNNAGNGFQYDVTTVAGGVEAGRPVTLLAGEAALGTAPNPVLATGAADPIAVRLTLPPGPLALAAEATDLCGNTGRSTPVNITLDIEGCASRIIGFDGPTTFGPDDGNVAGGALEIDVNGTVDLLDAACAAASAQLMLDGAPLGAPVVVGDGNVSFPGVAIPSGQHALVIQVTSGENSTSSLAQSLTVDLTAPTVEITNPAGVEPIVVLGSTVTYNVSVTEAPADSARLATLFVDDQQRSARQVPAGEDVVVNFIGIGTPAGQHEARVCVADAAGNEACDTIQINVDAAAPGALAPVAEITDPRLTQVTFTFTAPGDDGAVGNIDHYELRRAPAAFADEAAWAAAVNDVVAIVPPSDGVNVGDEEVLTITSALQLGELHFVSVRGVDDAGRLSPVTSVEVDLRLETVDFELTPNDGGSLGAPANAANLLTPLGDIDNDGFDDVLVTAADVAGIDLTYIVFGGEGAAPAEPVALDDPALTHGTFYGLGGGVADVNGDGFPDALVLGYMAGFAGTTVGIYFGCDQCDRADIAAPDSQINITGDFLSAVGGVGNFTALAGDLADYEEVAVGGSAFGNNYGTVIAGRAVWPAVVNATVADADSGIFRFVAPGPPAASGKSIATAGDVDGDGRTELLFSTGDFDKTYLFYGADGLPDTISYDAESAATVQLVNPCPTPESKFGYSVIGGVDLDGDAQARPDFVVGDRSAKRLIPFDQDGASLDCFRNGQTQFGGVMSFAGDVDGDGDIDLVAGHRGDLPPVPVAFVYYNDGTGHFGTGEGFGESRGIDVSLRQSVPGFGVAGAGRFNEGDHDDLATIGLLPNGNLQLRVFQ